MSQPESTVDEDKVNRFRTLIYLRQFTSECMVIYPLYAIMFSERGDLSMATISLLFIIWSVVTLACEIPTGALADRFSRRSFLILASLLEGTCFIIWLFVPNFVGYAIGFAVWGVGYACSSGALEAYIYDELDGQNASSRFTKIYARSQSIALAGTVVAYLLASIVGPEYNLLLIISLAMTAVCLITTMLLPKEQPRSHPDVLPGSGLIRSAMREVRSSSLLLRLVVCVALTWGIIGSIDEFVPLYYVNVGITTDSVTWYLLAGLLLTAIIGWHAHRFEQLGQTVFALMVLVPAVGFLITSQASTAVAVFGLLGFMQLINLSAVLYEAALQHAVTGTSRATIGSLPSLLAELIAILIIAMIGIVASNFGDSTAYLSLALMSVGLAAVPLVLARANARQVNRRA